MALANKKTPPRNIINDIEKDRFEKESDTKARLTKEIEALKEIITTKDDIIEDLFTELGKDDELDEFKDKYNDALIQIEKANEKIEHLEKQNNSLKEEITELKEDVKCLVTHVNDQELATYAEKARRKPNDSDTDKDGGENESQCINLVDSGIDVRSLTNLIDDRVAKKVSDYFGPQCRRSSEEEIVQSFFVERTGSTDQPIPDTVGHNSKERDQNIIIHGINEGEDTDTQYLSKFFDTLELDQTGVSVSYRLGKKQNERKRPLKIEMKSIDDKRNVMSRLGRLRYADDNFKKISVTDDYTVEERNEIKRWVMMASEKNTNGTIGDVWKVRGTPKTGMRLICVRHQ